MTEIEIRDLATGDAGWLLLRHGQLYARDEGYNLEFEAVVAEILAGFIRHRQPGRERAFIAHRGDDRLGSVFCVQGSAPDMAKLRLFLVDPAARGLGLGRRLLSECMGWARAQGYHRMELWTHESHRAACALYAEAGWRMTGQEATHAFGQDVVDQFWQVDL